MSGIIRIGEKYFNLEAITEEIEVLTYVSDTYGELKYLEYSYDDFCEPCEGAGEICDEEEPPVCIECETCIGEGIVPLDEIIVVHTYNFPEGVFRIPRDWHVVE